MKDVHRLKQRTGESSLLPGVGANKNTLPRASPNPGRSAEAATGEGAYQGARPHVPLPRLRGRGKETRIGQAGATATGRRHPENSPGPRWCREPFPLRRGAERPYLRRERVARSRASARARRRHPSAALSPGFQRRHDPASANAFPSGSRPPPPPPPELFTPSGPARRRRRHCRLLSTLAPLPIRPPPPPPSQPRLSGASSSHRTLRNRDSSRAGRKLPRKC